MIRHVSGDTLRAQHNGVGMKLFDPDNSTASERHKRIYALSEIAYTLVDFSAAALFVVGSVLFFSASTTDAATWLFLIGSVLFGLRPSIKLIREIAYLRSGDLDAIESAP